MSEIAGKRILLIEDHDDIAELLEMYFESHNVELLHAHTGEAGIELARTSFPNLILLDIGLPDIDGYDTCIQLRKASLTRYIPIIFLTQRDERTNKVKGLQLGADDYITKPFDIDELRLRVQASIRRATRENLHEARTGLPGGPLIEAERNRRSDHQYTELHFIVNGFEVYQDVYGFLAGSDVMDRVGETIQNTIQQHGTRRDFLGIIEDRFVLLTHTEDPETLVRAVCDKFDEEAKAFYTFADADRGGILYHEGQSDERFVPIMQILYKQIMTENS